MVNESNDWVSVWTHLIALYLKVQRAKIEGEGIRVNIRNDDGELVEKQVRTFRELQELVEESYPKTEQKDDKQQPGMNVITAIIRYARNYVLSTVEQQMFVT